MADLLDEVEEAVRNRTLEEIAQFCERHIMSIPYKDTKATHDIYVAAPLEDGDLGFGRHQGHGYAAAIRALKT